MRAFLLARSNSLIIVRPVPAVTDRRNPSEPLTETGYRDRLLALAAPPLGRQAIEVLSTAKLMSSLVAM
jgi:hypothetical protein